MDLLEFFANFLLALGSFETSGTKPRRVFTRGFVILCIIVAVVELIILNHIYSGRQ